MKPQLIGLLASLGTLVACTLESEMTPSLSEAGADARLEDDSIAAGDVAHTSVPVTRLPLTLLATQVADATEQSRATIRNNLSRVIAVYREGDVLAEGATVEAIHGDEVILVEGTARSRLAFGLEIIELTAADRYYPDLLEINDFSAALADGVPLPESRDYAIRTPAHAYGTAKTIRTLQRVARAYRRATQEQAPPVVIGDISKREGGSFPPHVSHRHGRDVDVAYVVDDAPAAPRFVRASVGNLDVRRTWLLMRTLLETDDIHYMFVDYALQPLLLQAALDDGFTAEELAEVFQYPSGESASVGIIRHWSGHDDHFHVRFRH